jgi:predicted DNA-binding transcriptional regulator AlpA
MKSNKTSGRARRTRNEKKRKLAPPGELSLLPHVLERVPLSAVTIWRLEKAGRFPARRRISFKRVAWLTREIDDYVAGKWGE